MPLKDARHRDGYQEWLDGLDEDSRFCADLIGGGLTFIAEKSGLVRWSYDAPELYALLDHKFEAWLRNRGDYARLASWVLFSVGAEYLLKGVCLAHAACPPPDRSDGYADMKTLSRYYRRPDQVTDAEAGSDIAELPPRRPYIDNLPLPHQTIVELHIAFWRLARIRDRDVHTLNKDVRQDDFEHVQPQFVPAFNILIHCMELHPLWPTIEYRWRRNTPDPEGA